MMNRKRVSNEPDHLYDEEQLEESLLSHEHTTDDPSIPSVNDDQANRRLLTNVKKPLLEYAAGGLAAISIVSSVLAMVFSLSAIVIVSGILASGLGPYGYVQQTKLTDIAALKETREKLAEEITILKISNDRFYNELIELGQNVNEMLEVEVTFQKITEFQGLSIEKLSEQVQKNKKALNSLERLYRTLTLQNLLSVIIASDKDNNEMIDKDELEVLIKRIVDINGVELNEDRFRQAVLRSGGALREVMTVIENAIEEGSDDADLFSLSTYN